MASDRGALAQRTALVLALAAAVPVAASGAQTRVHEPPPPVKRPPDGAVYTGTHRLTIAISGKEIQIAAFRFPCKATKGNTSLTGIPLERTPKGYRFEIDSNGIVSYADDTSAHPHPDENGKIHLEGRFGRLAKTVKGHFRVRTPRCGDSGRIDFSGTRQQS